MLLLGIISDLGILLYFKYGNFFVDNVNAALTVIRVAPLSSADVILPIGISFFTFHKISYKVDVYRGVADAKTSFIDLALYILMFPQLIAGPIVRYNEIADQMDSQHRILDRGEFAGGIRLFVSGLARKMLIANCCAVAADRIFELPPGEWNAGLAWLGITCYTLQIYYDFAGYSEMAIGLARMLGFHFPANFNYPYFATSITDFWHRWHMTLSRWFRDYLYIPLGGNRHGRWRTYTNLIIVFFLCGLWHGAHWSFVVWGLYHGSFLVLERTRGGRATLALTPPLLRHVYVMLVVMVGWVVFRAATLEQAISYLLAMLGRGSGCTWFASVYIHNDLILAMVVGGVGAAPVIPVLQECLERWQERCPALTRGISNGLAAASLLTHALLFLLSLGAIAAGTYSPFIYFRF
jgi:alginate O-acetyltransferase complex protein AlgI